MARIFISHQRLDSLLAGKVVYRLNFRHSIDFYLDVIDPFESQSGDELADHLREQLGKCTQLMAVVSENTKASWWVPWEIGVASEKEYPIATYAGDNTQLPGYLEKWPYLRSEADLDIYARETKNLDIQFQRRGYSVTEQQFRAQTTRSFHRTLKAALGQR
jgi:hypothetical protein